MKIVMVAGEASGDALGAHLLSRLRELHPELEAFGIGGEKMQRLGFHSWYDMQELSVMGLIEPLKRLPRLLSIRRDVRRRSLEMKPDIFIGIDAPDFNLNLEVALKKKGVRTAHYVSPSVWAWRKRRVFTIQKAADMMMTLFPFEVDFYRAHQVPAVCVGHPMASEIPLERRMAEAKHELGIPVDQECIALLPGSRSQELHYHIPLFLTAALRCFQKNPSLHFITAQINEQHEQRFREACKQLAPNLPITFFKGRARTVMSAANAVLVAAGTATLETLLCKTPMVIAYYTTPWMYRVFTWIVSLKYIGLPNILSGHHELVPEFVQDRATPEALSDALMHVLSPEEQARQMAVFHDLHRALFQQPNQQAGDVIHRLITSSA